MISPRNYETASRRWEGVGPYYAMFPTRFADAVVSQFTRKGDLVLDPFAGRGTAIFSAASQGRRAIGIEINPVGWCYAKVKTSPAPLDAVEARLKEISGDTASHRRDAQGLPKFFHHCFSRTVQEFLLAARASLDWRFDSVDRTAMALLLVHLHGKQGSAFSSQMRQTKSMAPDYAIRWWKEHGFEPPDIDPLAFMSKRLAWRYAKGVPDVCESEVHLGDAESFAGVICRTLKHENRKVSLIFTSPPYYRMTNYHYDQWLRLWLLGGPPSARRVPGSTELQGKFENAKRYGVLLTRVFAGISQSLSQAGVVYVRTGRGPVTLTATREALREAFPAHELQETERPYTRPTQTSLFGDSQPKAGEIDLVMLPRKARSALPLKFD